MQSRYWHGVSHCLGLPVGHAVVIKAINDYLGSPLRCQTLIEVQCQWPREVSEMVLEMVLNMPMIFRKYWKLLKLLDVMCTIYVI